VAHFNSQYLKRLKKLSLTEKKLQNELHTPFAEIVSVEQKDNMAIVTFNLSDSKYNLTSYNIYINNVPIYSGGGKLVLNKKKIKLTDKVRLLKGNNKIEVTCFNEKGAESFRKTTYVKNDILEKSNLYFLAFGVSKYNNPELNLKYAHKDVIDLENTFKTYRSDQFENIYSKVLINEEVIPENIVKSKEFLKNAKENDVLVLMIAGHGMHENNSNADYYFLTYNADINNLKYTTVNFELIEDLMDGILPRKKLFLMDACESGELDEDESKTIENIQNDGKIAFRGFKQVLLNQQESKQKYAKPIFQKDRYIYNDLSRRTGAIVFSSSKGGELSAERSDYENGLFTEYIIKAFQSKKADCNNDGLITIDELKRYVLENVSIESNNKQHPTIDRDNIFQRISF